MGNRSYVIAEKSGVSKVLLEASDMLPLLWVAALPSGSVGAPNALPTGSLGIEDRIAIGFSLTPSEAASQLIRRQALIERWFGDAGSMIVDQFVELLNRDSPERIHLDLTEYVDLHESPTSFLDMLEKAVAALDTDPSKGGSKRRPTPIRWLMDHFELSGVSEGEPIFGRAMAGGMPDDTEPWHREPPRPKRAADDRLFPSNDAHRISRDGGVIVAGVHTAEYLNTPVVWSRESRAAQVLDVADNIGSVWVHHLSHDGSVLVGGCQTYPNLRYTLFRCRDGKIEPLGTDPARVFLVADITDDASILVGNHHSTDKDYEVYRLTSRAFRMDSSNVPEDVGPPGIISAASVVTPDGRYVGGSTEHGPLETREARAFVWSLESGCADLGAGFFSLEWVAISPDGQRGVLSFMTARGGPTGYQYWRRGCALQTIEELEGASWVRVSAAVDAIVAHVRGLDTPMLWTCRAGLERLDFGAPSGKLIPLYVSDGASAIVAAELAAGGSASCSGVLIMSDGGVHRHQFADERSDDLPRWHHVNRPPHLRDFVVSGQMARQGVHVCWTLARGLERRPEPVALRADAGDIRSLD